MQRTSACASAKPAPSPVGRPRKVYERIAPLYDLMDGVYERSWKARLRREVFEEAVGVALLDAGVGTGCNMPFYPKGMVATGVDASPAMLERTAERAGKLGLDVRLAEVDLLNLDLPDASFDTVVCTFVLLCLPDELQAKALAEMRRVLKDDGRLLILDYRPAEGRILRAWQKLMTPWLRFAFAGRFDARTEDAIGPAGLRLVERRVRAGGSVHLLVLETA